MTVTATKTIKFDDLMKVMKKYVATKDTRPVLQYVSYDGKYFTGTNSHHLLRVNAECVSDIPAEYGESFIYNPKQELKLNAEYDYPDTSRLIPDINDYNSTADINGNIKELQQHIKAAKNIVKKNRNKVVKLEFTNTDTWITGDNYNEEGEYIEYTKKMNSLYVNGNDITVHVNSDYINTALDVVKKLSKLSYNQVNLNMKSAMRPIHINQNGIFDIIVLPIRMQS
jgi:hypothetical protein